MQVRVGGLNLWYATEGRGVPVVIPSLAGSTFYERSFFLAARVTSCKSLTSSCEEIDPIPAPSMGSRSISFRIRCAISSIRSSSGKSYWLATPATVSSRWISRRAIPSESHISFSPARRRPSASNSRPKARDTGRCLHRRSAKPSMRKIRSGLSPSVKRFRRRMRSFAPTCWARRDYFSIRASIAPSYGKARIRAPRYGIASGAAAASGNASRPRRLCPR